MLSFQFLGTGTSQGVPVIGCPCEVCTSEDPRDSRLRSAGLFSMDGKHLAIDIGPDFRQQILRTGIRTLEGILITHEHNDHVIGMDEVRPFNFMSRSDVQVYAEQRVLKELRIRFAYIFTPQPYPGAPQVRLNAIDALHSIETANFTVTPLRIMHGGLPILGFRIQNIAYCTDVKHIPEETLEKMEGLEHLILSALHHNRHHSHSNLEEAVELASKIGAKHTWFTHCSHNMGTYEKINNILPENMQLAYDGLVVSSN